MITRREGRNLGSLTRFVCALIAGLGLVQLLGIESPWVGMREPAAQDAAAPADAPETTPGASSAVIAPGDESSTEIVSAEGQTSPTVEPTEPATFPWADYPTSAALLDLEPLNIFRDGLSDRLLTRRNRKPFEYDAKGRPDPMILPWVMNELLIKAYRERAERYIKQALEALKPAERNRLLGLAEKELDRIIEIDPSTREGQDAVNRKAEVLKFMREEKKGSIELLPRFIRENTIGIELAERIAIIGGQRVPVGQFVPGYETEKTGPDGKTTVTVKVLGIKADPRDTVTYEITGGTQIDIEAIKPELPPWVISNTKAVIFDGSAQGNHLALVGDNLLKVNDVIPQYGEVKIADITRDRVIYEIQGVRIAVDVKVEVREER